MTNKKWLYMSVNILLYAVGFPVLFIVSLVKSIEWNSYGMYGASSFAPLIAVIILWALTAGIQTAVYFTCKKKGKTGFSLAVKLFAVPVALIVGLFGILDIAMPPLLKDATSNTILYEDVVDGYQDVHEKIYARVEDFKKKNGLDESVKYQDKEFQDIFQPLFKSMDKAYNAFDPLAIEIALDQPDLLEAITNGNMPIMLAATLLLETAGGNKNDHNITMDELLKKNVTNILLAVGGLDFDNLTNEEINAAINKILVTKEFNGIEWNIFNILGSNMLFPEFDPNAHIYMTNEYDVKVDVGASLGYQDMAWLNGIPMMFFIPLMSMRTLLYAFAALMALLTVVQFFIAEAYAKKSEEPFAWYMLPSKKSVKA